jgi:2-haloacid dehalogenase
MSFDCFRSYRDATRLTLERAAGELGIALMPAQRTAIADNWAALPIFEDTVPALTQLKNDGWKLAVLTNCDEDLFAQTQRAIGLPFDALVTAERVRSYKPALAHFEYFRDRVLGEGDEWVHTACSWFHDIAPARELGISRIWIDRDRSGHDPSAATAVLPNLTRLRDVANAL